MYSWSSDLSQISLKNSIGNIFYLFKFSPKTKWREMKIGYLDAILKRYKYFIYLWIIYLIN